MEIRELFESGELIVEKTLTNMNALSDCADLIIENMPYNFPSGMDDEYLVSDFRGAENLIKKYENTKFEGNIKVFVSKYIVRYISEKSNLGGALITGHGRYELLLNIAGYMHENADFTRYQILDAAHADAGIKTFKSVVLHELRHLFQQVEYPNYSNSERNISYTKDPIEVDAAWHHHLQDRPPYNYSNAQSYVKDVMAGFTKYKDLSDKQIRHYAAKTAAYWHDYSTVPSLPRGATPLERFKEKQEKVAKLISSSLQSKNRPDDLREYIPNYNPDSRSFFVPDKWYEVMASLIMARVAIIKENAVIAYLVIGLTVPKDEIPSAKKYLSSVSKIDINDAMAGCDKLSEKGFDGEAIRNFFLSTY